MCDIWSFLLQTLTASGVAALLLLVKTMFRDKLSPRWQFAVWGLLLWVLLMPAGIAGRAVLINWPMIVEAIKSLTVREYSLTQVKFPFPIIHIKLPQSVLDGVFFIYQVGVVMMILRYVISYMRLRRAVLKGQAAEDNIAVQIFSVAAVYDLPVCPAVRVKGVDSAFICGIFKPILVLPAKVQVDDKILMHELLHLKQRDTFWGLVICVFRCIHWCNPLLWYCAGLVGNDLEARCDYRVLLLLKGEERRDYGRILLAMANEKYACLPGTSSMANGGRNIRRRIESIVRFKKYPAGMALVSVCIVVILAMPLAVGTKKQNVYQKDGRLPARVETALALASARTVWCATPAGALDAYGKAVLEQNGTYRAMCAPLNMQKAIAVSIETSGDSSPDWDSGVTGNVDISQGYYVYNLEEQEKNSYTAVLVVVLSNLSDGKMAEENMMYIAMQYVQVVKEGTRWVVIPEKEFQVRTAQIQNLNWGCDVLPSYTYEDTQDDFCVKVHQQMVFAVDDSAENNPGPDAEFNCVYRSNWGECSYVGNNRHKDSIYQIGVSIAPMQEGGERPSLKKVSSGNTGGSDSEGNAWYSKMLETGWDSVMSIGGGGSTIEYKNAVDAVPDCYAADVYINGSLASEMTLYLQGGEYE